MHAEEATNHPGASFTFGRAHLAATGRYGMKALAQALLPASVAFWSGPTHGSRRNRGRVALTFDDGPTELTRDYLDVLERFGAKATFFVVGELCARHPDWVEAISNRGHELAGHGYTHRRFTELSAHELSDELHGTQALLPRRDRQRPLVRPPHGALSLASTIACTRAGFTLALWSYDSGDSRTELAEDVAAAFLRKPVEPGAIVLFHEGQAWTMDALPTILETLTKAGHELCTVGQLLGAELAR
jgi:peptidoglycan-N-acetylglucosamine deacetylase